MAEKDLKEKADQLQKVYLQNLALKLREGKSLSEREFEHLRLLSRDLNATDVPPPEQPPLSPFLKGEVAGDVVQECNLVSAPRNIQS